MIHHHDPATIAVAGAIQGYELLIFANAVVITFPDGHEEVREVPNYGTSIGELSTRPRFALGWGKLPDDSEILYLYDKDDAGFGYALNLSDDWCSEWGFSPFGR